MSGPLDGIRVIEIASIGPGPFAAMMLADAGADVIRLERAGAAAGLGSGSWNHTHRGRPSVGCDLKNPEGRDLALRLAGSADALIEGFRPGVMERLGLGPDELLARNPKLVYGRMTGWGQDGPLVAGRRPRRQLHLDRRRARLVRARRGSGRCSRSTSSATTAAAR